MDKYISKLEERGDLKISPHLVMRIFSVSFEIAQNICNAFWLKRNREARELAKLYE